MSKFDEVATKVLEWVVAQGGEYHTEPGELLKQIAEETGEDYFAVAMAVRKLEELEFVQVERWSYPDPRKANKLCGIALAPGMA